MPPVRVAAAAVLALVGAACRSPAASSERPDPATAPAAQTELGSRGPSPEYPTPALAGTEQLFLLEEPPRGPHLTTVRMPDRAGLRFSEHAVCEIDAAHIVCSQNRPKAGQARW